MLVYCSCCVRVLSVHRRGSPVAALIGLPLRREGLVSEVEGSRVEADEDIGASDSVSKMRKLFDD